MNLAILLLYIQIEINIFCRYKAIDFIDRHYGYVHPIVCQSFRLCYTQKEVIPLMLRLIITDDKGRTLYNAHFLLYYKEQELISFVNKKKWVN